MATNNTLKSIPVLAPTCERLRGWTAVYALTNASCFAVSVACMASANDAKRISLKNANEAYALAVAAAQATYNTGMANCALIPVPPGPVPPIGDPSPE